MKLNERIEVTDQQVIKNLRKIVEPDGKKGNWLRHLDDKQLIEVYHRIKLNHSLYRIINLIQKKWNICVSSEPRSLYRGIKAFKQKIVGLLQQHESSYPVTLEKRAFIKREEERAKRIIKEVNAMEELAWLIQTQRERLEVMVEREKIGIPSKWTDQTVEQLRECLDIYLKHAEELGIIDIKPKEWTLNLKAQFDGLLKNVVRDDGSRLIFAANRFLELAEQKALVMKETSEGKYELDRNKGNEHEGK